MEERFKLFANQMRYQYKVLIYLFFGLIWSLANVGYSIAPLTWFALVPYLFFIRYERVRSGFFYSAIFGTSLYIFHIWWMVAPFPIFLGNSEYSTLPPLLGTALGYLLGTICYLIISIFTGLSYGFIFWISRLISRGRGYIFCMIFPIVFTVFDYFYPKLWVDQTGYSQYIFIHFSQIADIFGVPFITLLLIYSNCSALLLIKAFLYRRFLPRNIIPFGVVLGLVIISSIYGVNRFNWISEKQKESPTAKIAIIQGNISGLEKNNVSKSIEVYNRLSNIAAGSDPDLIIWPESAIKAAFDKKMQSYQAMVKRYDGPPLLFGTHIIEWDEEGKDYSSYNAMVLTDSKGRKMDDYYKVKLLSFIEEFPIPFAAKLMKAFGIGSFTRGAGPKVLELGEIRFAPNICYEAIIPDLVRRSAEVDGVKANLLINGTNDSWFGRTIEPKIHMHMAGFRAIENRKYLARATCTGYSAIFDAGGSIINRRDESYDGPKLFEEDIIIKDVHLLDIPTIYNRGGWLFIYLLGALVIIATVVSYIIVTRRKLLQREKREALMHKKALSQNWLD